MKNLKRILAAAGAILLIAMYVSTLVFAFIDHSKTLGLLKASIACTIILPCLLYAYSLVYKISKRQDIEFPEKSIEDSLEDPSDNFSKDSVNESSNNSNTKK